MSGYTVSTLTLTPTVTAVTALHLKTLSVKDLSIYTWLRSKFSALWEISFDVDLTFNVSDDDKARLQDNLLGIAR